MSPAVVTLIGALVLAAAFWAVFIAVLVRRSRRVQAQQAKALAVARPGWARMSAFPSTEVAASLRAKRITKPGPASLLYGSDGIELRFGDELFVALRWATVADILECDLTLPGTRQAPGVRVVLVDGRTLELRLFPSRELRRRHPGQSLQGAAVAELLAVRSGARPSAGSPSGEGVGEIPSRRRDTHMVVSAEQFVSAVDRWWDMTFPPGSDKPVYDEFKSDLVLADLWVADMVLPFVRHGVVRPDPIGIADKLAALHERAVDLGLEAVKESDRLLTAWYAEYATTLRDLYAMYLERVTIV